MTRVFLNLSCGNVQLKPPGVIAACTPICQGACESKSGYQWIEAVADSVERLYHVERAECHTNMTSV